MHYVLYLYPAGSCAVTRLSVICMSLVRCMYTATRTACNTAVGMHNRYINTEHHHLFTCSWRCLKTYSSFALWCTHLVCDNQCGFVEDFLDAWSRSVHQCSGGKDIHVWYMYTYVYYYHAAATLPCVYVYTNAHECNRCMNIAPHTYTHSSSLHCGMQWGLSVQSSEQMVNSRTALDVCTE